MVKKIGILASYNGSGFETIQKAIESGILDAKVEVIITNNSNAGVLEKAKNYGVKSFVINQKLFPEDNIDLKISQTLKTFDCDYIFLSGYMKKIEENMLKTFPNKIINTHPAILPSIYGGAGMYGSFVHQAVVKNGEKKSGVTIHYVNENYDEGEKILIKELSLNSDETAESLEIRIKELEKIAIVEAFVKLLA
ncbi:phosphoribosylglycinamide formyltransferase [Aliarcobacter thereius]|uniref:phosphoribosylglycinamide formyltransferase 1 n=2 Tax=Aliarcobacter thereius TaxID=544718 RepID=A0A1C0BA53_9BACT|nr:phosphoribosylglycinamide formyltransferase [Aliarcobacter thereius]OCL95030.1 Phosphoribosylglycinamide formyltransferase [Aliarcobacter thereius LMG 24486]OCM00478.1 Phosphoribosylglycinamide formyltransferase [Aliarcobacter thereius]QBF16978.1 phosphoribosylglycinamide formyltransferase 1 [Aliarcobacter thereius LMG 24486]TLS92917.1 phosphoribosylglycinamide formyltransferase [Aliarcobacter thereius]